MRIAQCREGWHLTTELATAKPEPTQEQVDLLAYIADLVHDYRSAVATGDSESEVLGLWHAAALGKPVSILWRLSVHDRHNRHPHSQSPSS